MRQQLISWLVDDLAPEIRRSRDAQGTILKFANEKNLSPSLVQAMGQLYNTAKTIAFLEKAGSRGRGDSFPILDVDELVAKYIDMPKEAGVSQGTIDNWELDNPDGVLKDLPACFEGILTPAFVEEKVINTVPKREFQKAAAVIDITRANRELTLQILFETKEEMTKAAKTLVVNLRSEPSYPFEELEADVLGLHGERMRPVMDKLANFLAEEGWKVIRAKAASDNKLIGGHAERMVNLVDQIDDGMFRLQAASEYLEKEAKPPTPPPNLPNPPGFGAPGPSQAATGSVRFREPGSDAGSKSKGGENYFGDLNDLLDKALGARKPVMKQLGTAFVGDNEDQRKVDNEMLNARHMSVLSNLMTTDEILSEADPDRLAQLYNSVREVAPDMATDINVMRVLLRSAIQHEGISHFDLKGFLETEIEKQKMEEGRRKKEDVLYGRQKPKPKETEKSM